MDINTIINFFWSNIYIFLLVIPFLSQLWILPVWAMFFILFAWSSATSLSQLLVLFLIVLFSSVSWDFLAYFIWKKFFHSKFFQYLLNKKSIKCTYKKSKKFFRKKWKISIFLTRFLITWIWAVINYVIWIQRFSFKIFSLYVILWEILYSSELLILWYIFKDTFEDVSNIISNFSLVMLVAFILYEIWIHLFWRNKIHLI